MALSAPYSGRTRPPAPRPGVKQAAAVEDDLVALVAGVGHALVPSLLLLLSTWSRPLHCNHIHHIHQNLRHS